MLLPGLTGNDWLTPTMEASAVENRVEMTELYQQKGTREPKIEKAPSFSLGIG